MKEDSVVIEKPATLDTNMWKFEEFEPQPVVDTLWPIVAKLKPKIMTTSEGEDITDLHEMRTPVISGSEFCFSTDKIGKGVIFVTAGIQRLVCGAVLISPNDDYDFPMFEVDHFEYADRVVFLLDMHPLRDLTTDAWYREKYLDPVEPIWKEYLDLNDGVERNDFLSPFLSPYSIRGHHKPVDDKRSNIARMLECTAKYLEYYVDRVVAEAEPVSDPEGRAFAIKQKDLVRDTYRAQDPTVRKMSEELGLSFIRKTWYHSCP
jgi:hypothetical protein